MSYSFWRPPTLAPGGACSPSPLATPLPPLGIFLPMMSRHIILCPWTSLCPILLASKIGGLSHELHIWTSSSRLSLNSSKTQFGTTQHLQKIDLLHFSHRFPHFTFLSSVRDLGATLDSSLIFSNHISNLTPCSYFHLRRLRCKSVYTPGMPFVHAFVCSRIDHCNSLSSLKSDYQRSSPCSMLPLDLLFAFLFYLASPRLWHIN